MSAKRKAFGYAAIFAIAAVFIQYAGVQACSVDDFLLTKGGSLAATTPQLLNSALASAAENEAKIADLLKNGTVVKLKESIKVQVLERSVEWRMLRIKLPGDNASYWVKDGALKPLDCK